MKKTILIIGAGLAGLSAALQAAEEGCKVKLISSMPSERAQSVMAEGGINAALNIKEEDDSPEQHYEDTIKAGCGLADPNAVWNMTQAAPELVRWLHRIGVAFNIDDHDEIDLRNFGGQKKKRTAFSKSDTGKQLMTALIDAIRKKEIDGQIERFSHHSFVTLHLHDNICNGCVIQDRYSGEMHSLIGNAVILATGGMHGLFGNTTGSLANTGEVTAELFRLGIPMANLEMIQYHPTTAAIGGKRLLISEAARGEGGRLFAKRDGKPWYFMEEMYPELGNLMPRDITARTIRQVRTDYPVYLDMTEISKDRIEKKLSGLLDDCLTYLHQDIRKEPIAVSPGIHYFMGGIFVDECHRTPVKNLYAAGECCCQYHGANRLGGNSLLGAIYGGKIAAQTACLESPDQTEPFFINKETLVPTEPAHVPIRLHEILQKAMDVVRDETTLKTGLAQLQTLQGSRSLLGQAMIKSALARQESRGAHWRSDYPLQNDEIGSKTTVAVYDGTTIKISFAPIPKRRCIQ
ncbi:FAD-binding protein [Ruminococcus callidus]